jgi:hypothetical protein
MKTYIVKLQQAAVMTGIVLSGIGAGSIVPAHALTFNFNPAAGTSQQAIDGFTTAGSMWSSLFTDNVTVNVNINFSALGAGTLGETSSSTRSFGYDRVYNALNNDPTSADDRTAVNSLSKAPAFNILINRTANSPNGAGSATPYLDNNGDANNKTINMTSGNAKALGLLPNETSNDASISFNNIFNWDFNRNDGISGGAFDFVGIAAHELGHSLGFGSGVNILDSNGSGTLYNDNQYTYVSPLDLFRYSTDSKNANAIDWTADARDKYFSLDGGATNIAALATGDVFGDGRQNGHWKDNLGLGIMDPTISSGELLQITENDKRALDAIGWNRIDSSVANSQVATFVKNNNGIAGAGNISRVDATAVPEPADFVGTLIFAAITVKITIARRKQRSIIDN